MPRRPKSKLIKSTNQAQSAELKYISIRSILIKNRFRKDLGDIRSLAESIRDIGLLNPITVEKHKSESTVRYVLLAGERRTRACQLLGRKRILAQVLSPCRPEALVQ